MNFRIADDGYTVLKKDPSGKEWIPLTKDEVDEIVKRTNTEDRYGKKSHYEISPDGTVYTVDNEDATKRKILGKQYRTSFLKNLNTAVNELGKHYDYKGDSATLKVNKSEYVDDGSTGNKKFERLKYGDIDDSDIKLILSKSNPNKDNKKPKSIVGYENGHFTKDGTEMTSKQLVSFVRLLNGQVGDTTKLLNPRAWGKSRDDYWKSYKISIAGSKVGKAVNFNLPPGKNGSCRSEDLPCA